MNFLPVKVVHISFHQIWQENHQNSRSHKTQYIFTTEINFISSQSWRVIFWYEKINSVGTAVFDGKKLQWNL